MGNCSSKEPKIVIANTSIVPPLPAYPTTISKTEPSEHMYTTLADQPKNYTIVPSAYATIESKDLDFHASNHLYQGLYTGQQGTEEHQSTGSSKGSAGAYGPPGTVPGSSLDFASADPYQGFNFSKVDSDHKVLASVDANGLDANWNEQFQRALEMPERTPEETMQKYLILTRLSTDFVKLAASYGRTIITELSLPTDKKTVRTTSQLSGGVAGGEKFAINGIVFKLARDPIAFTDSKNNPVYVYGGSSPNVEYASKAAGHELKGAIHYFSAQKELQTVDQQSKKPDLDLRVPMQALVDFRGYRLVAMPLLPISKATVVYGSSDQCRTVHASDLVLNRGMKTLGDHLHIQGLVVNKIQPTPDAPVLQGPPNDSAPFIQLATAADVEGHVGGDSRRYLLDLARAFPPEVAAICTHLPIYPQAILYRFLRPEFLSYLKKNSSVPPLNPDAFLMWSQHDPRFREYQKDLESATRILITELIPDTCREWLDSESPFEPSVDTISVELHRRGINLRHMGLLRTQLPEDSKISQVLLVEIVKRTLKNIIRSRLRGESKEHTQQVSEYMMKTATVDFLNLVSGAHEASSSFWAFRVIPAITHRFGISALGSLLKSAVGDKSVDAMKEKEREEISLSVGQTLFHGVKDQLPSIITYLLNVTGMALSPQCLTDFRNRANALKFQFTAADIIDGPLQVKHMTLIDYAEGRLLYTQAKELLNSAPSVASRLLALSSEKFDDALRAEPSNTDALRESTLATVEKHTCEGNAAAADQTLLTALRRLLVPPPPISTLLLVARPFILYLLQMWEDRIKDPTSVYVHLVGASSREAMTEMATLVQKYEVQIEHARSTLGGSKKVPIDQEPKDSKFYSFTQDVDRLRSAAFDVVERFFKLMKMATDDAITRFARLSRRRFVKEGMNMDKMGGKIRPEEIVSQWEFFFGLLEHASKPFPASAGPARAGKPDLELVALLHEIGFSVDQADPYGHDTALSKASKQNNVNLVRFLLQCHANVDRPDDDGFTALSYAASLGYAEVVKLLLQAGANVHHQDKAKKTALHRAAVRNFADVASLLLSAGARCDQLDDEGMTPLHRASIDGHCEVAKILLEKGGKMIINVRDNKLCTPLVRACTHGYASAAYVKLLLSNGANVDIVDDKEKTALMRTADHAEADIAKSLIEAKANIHLKENTGCNALMLVVLNYVEETRGQLPDTQRIVKMLLDVGIDVNAKDDELRTALIHSCMEQKPQLVDLLLRLKKGTIELNHQDNLGRTALIHAARLGLTKIVKLLLDAGADASTKDASGSTAEMWARLYAKRSQDHSNVLELLTR